MSWAQCPVLDNCSVRGRLAAQRAGGQAGPQQRNAVGKGLRQHRLGFAFNNTDLDMCIFGLALDWKMNLSVRG